MVARQVQSPKEVPPPAVPAPEQGKALSDLKQELRCGADPDVHLRAKGALLRLLGPAGLAVELIDVLTGARGERGNAQARYSAVCSLRDLGKLASSQAAPLAVAMRDEDVHVRQAAAFALSAMGRETSLAEPLVSKELLAASVRSGEAVDVRLAAAAALKELGVREDLRQYSDRHLQEMCLGDQSWWASLFVWHPFDRPSLHLVFSNLSPGDKSARPFAHNPVLQLG